MAVQFAIAESRGKGEGKIATHYRLHHSDFDIHSRVGI